MDSSIEERRAGCSTLFDTDFPRDLCSIRARARFSWVHCVGSSALWAQHGLARVCAYLDHQMISCLAVKLAFTKGHKTMRTSMKTKKPLKKEWWKPLNRIVKPQKATLASEVHREWFPQRGNLCHSWGQQLQSLTHTYSLSNQLRTIYPYGKLFSLYGPLLPLKGCQNGIFSRREKELSGMPLHKNVVSCWLYWESLGIDRMHFTASALLCPKMSRRNLIFREKFVWAWAQEAAMLKFYCSPVGQDLPCPQKNRENVQLVPCQWLGCARCHFEFAWIQRIWATAQQRRQKESLWYWYPKRKNGLCGSNCIKIATVLVLGFLARCLFFSQQTP